MAEERDGKIISTGNTTCACGPGCVCGCGHHCMHRVLWWIVGIVALIIVFCLGVKAGEFSDALHSMYGGYYRDYPVMTRVYNSGYGDGGVAVPVTGSAAGGATGTSGAVPAGQ